jgi:ankyrin repeat protein
MTYSASNPFGEIIADLLELHRDSNLRPQEKSLLVKICTSLVNHVYDINLQYKGHGLLSSSLVSDKTYEVTNELLHYCADVRLHDELTGNTPLHIATCAGNLPMAKLLLKNGADVDARCHLGSTALHDAYSPEMIDLLITQGATVDAQNNKGATPLHFSVECEDFVTVEALLSNNARIDIENKAGETPLGIAEEFCCPEMVALLKKYSAKRRRVT